MSIWEEMPIQKTFDQQPKEITKEDWFDQKLSFGAKFDLKLKIFSSSLVDKGINVLFDKGGASYAYV